MSTRSDATKKRLFDAAMELIGERGFTDASVDEIVERAGVAKGTVYYHFAGKAELVEALIADRFAPLAAAFRAAAASNADDPRAAIEAIVRAELEFLSEHSSFSKLLLTEMWREDRVWRETLVLARKRAVHGHQRRHRAGRCERRVPRRRRSRVRRVGAVRHDRDGRA